MSDQERIEQLEADLSAARFAADLHLKTVIVQQRIIKGLAEQLAGVTPSGASPCR